MTVEIKTPKYHFKYIDIKYEVDIFPDIELCREFEFLKVKRKFRGILEKHKAKPKKGSLYLNADKILVRYIFNNYSMKFKKAKDGIFHSTKSDVITNDIVYVFSNISLQTATIISNELNIESMFKKAIKKLKKIKLSKTTHYQKSSDIDSIAFKSLGLIKHHFEIPKKIYERLQNRYDEYKVIKTHNYALDDLIYSLLLRYNTLSSGGHQWGMPFKIRDRFNKELDFGFECFASSFNHYYSYYCSMFYDIEKYFMSVGPFQNITYLRGNFMANPPYEITLLNTMVLTFNQALKSKEHVAFMYGIPDWTTSFNEKFKFIDDSKESEFYKGHIIMEPLSYSWHDFMNYNASQKIPQSFRYVLANYNINFSKIKKIMDEWKSLQ
jgi:hypothetical protein